MEEEIFDAKELYAMEHTPNGRSRRIDSIHPRHRRKMVYENMHLMKGMTFTKIHQNPQLAPYNGPTDFKIVSYLERNKHDGKNEALHFFLDDYRFRDAVWDKLDKTTYAINKFDYLFTPDFSLWVDLPTDFFNKEEIFRTRFVGAYWQMCGFNVIPTASWGGLSSFSFCFDGLPMNSVMAVSGMGNRKNANAFNLWCYGLRRLEEEKKPTLIIVYGEEVEVKDLNTPLQFIPSFIQNKLRKL